MSQPGARGRPQQQAEPEPKPGVLVGDHVYCHHKGGPVVAKVAAHGRHGITAEIDGKHHPITWDRVLGHKRRASLSYRIVDEGEDGCIVEDSRGLRQFINVPAEAREGEMIVKSGAGHRLALFLKADGAPYMGAPGLTKKQLTDKRGVQTTRWVRATPDAPKPQIGHHVGWVNGEVKGRGKVTGVGKDGLQATDPAGGEHLVRHEHVTHRWDHESEPNYSPHAPEPGAHPDVVEKKTFAGMAINVERKAGSVRTKTPRGGGPTWSMTMSNDYGEIPGTKASDGDPVDVYIGPNEQSQHVFVVNQVKKDGKTFDEHKAMLGFDDEAAARQAYMAHYPPDWKGLHSVTAMSMDQFKRWAHGEIKPEPAKPPAPEVKAHEGDPDSFNAEAFAKQFDDPSASADSIIDGIGGDARQRLDDAAKLVGEVKQTIHQHTQPDGGWTAQRAELHRKIIFDGVTVRGKKVPGLLHPDRIKAATPQPGQKPTFIALGGRGGSGKSSLDGRVYNEARAIVLDADHIKGMLPEYEGWNAHQVHEESSHVLETALAMAKILGVNVVLDATMKTGKSIEQKVDEFKSGGFRIEAHYMHLPRQEAAKRAVSRYLDGGATGRYVPPQVVLGNTKNEANFDAIKRKADAWSFHDNSGAKGSGPKLISSKGEPATVAKKVLLKSEQRLILLVKGKRS